MLTDFLLHVKHAEGAHFALGEAMSANAARLAAALDDFVGRLGAREGRCVALP